MEEKFKSGRSTFILLNEGYRKNQVIVLVDRSNTTRKSPVFHALRSELEACGITFYEFRPFGGLRKQKPDPMSRLWRYLQRNVRSRWPDFPGWFDYLSPERHEIDVLAKELGQGVKRLSRHNSVCLLTHSRGGRIATRMMVNASARLVAGCICFGYPFKHPSKGPQKSRVRHLQALKSPCLIFQGLDDAYGGEEMIRHFTLSKAINIVFLDANHNYMKVDSEDRRKIFELVAKFLHINTLTTQHEIV